MIPDIDTLRKQAKVIQYFGLGFVQIKISDVERYHFYHSTLKKTADEEIHNHRCGFKSTILGGSLGETVYSLTIGDKYFVKASNCKEGSANTLLDYKVDAKPFTKTTYYKGSHYFRYPHEFHRVYCSDYCLTNLYLFLPKAPNALVLIKDKKDVDYCPFKSEYNESGLWEIVDKVISLSRF